MKRTIYVYLPFFLHGVIIQAIWGTPTNIIRDLAMIGGFAFAGIISEIVKERMEK